jgi:hypothetical protein
VSETINFLPLTTTRIAAKCRSQPRTEQRQRDPSFPAPERLPRRHQRPTALHLTSVSASDAYERWVQCAVARHYLPTL